MLVGPVQSVKDLNKTKIDLPWRRGNSASRPVDSSCNSFLGLQFANPPYRFWFCQPSSLCEPIPYNSSSFSLICHAGEASCLVWPALQRIPWSKELMPVCSGAPARIQWGSETWQQLWDFTWKRVFHNMSMTWVSLEADHLATKPSASPAWMQPHERSWETPKFLTHRNWNTGYL